MMEVAVSPENGVGGDSPAPLRHCTLNRGEGAVNG